MNQKLRLLELLSLWMVYS